MKNYSAFFIHIACMSALAAPDLSHEQRLREEERARIARDLHDDLGAQLTGIGMALGLLREQLAREQHAALPQADYAQQLLDQAREGMERLIDDLHPPVVEFGLADALRWQCRHFSRQTALECHVQCPDTPSVQEPFVVVSLLRILREALANVARHAQAGKVEVSLAVGAELILQVADDGIGLRPQDAGLDQQRSSGGHGLANMRMRAAALGGSLMLEARPGGGSLLSVRLPVAH